MKRVSWNLLRLLVILSLVLASCASMAIDECAVGSGNSAYLQWDPESDPAAMAFITSGLYPGKSQEELALLYFTYNVKYECRKASEMGLAGMYVVPLSRLPEIGMPLAGVAAPVAASTPLITLLGGSTIAFAYTQSPAYQSKMAAIEGARQIQPSDMIVVPAGAIQPKMIAIPLNDPTLPGIANPDEFYRQWAGVQQIASYNIAHLQDGFASDPGYRRRETVNANGYTIDFLWLNSSTNCVGEAHTLFFYQNENGLWDVAHLLSTFKPHAGPCTADDFVNAIEDIINQAIQIFENLPANATQLVWDKTWAPFARTLFRLAETIAEKFNGSSLGLW